MVPSSLDKDLVATYFTDKDWHVIAIGIKEFPGNRWDTSSVNRVIEKVESTRSTERKVGGGIL